MLNNPKFGSIYSGAEIAERNKPKPVSEDDDDAAADDEEEGEVDKGPIDVATLVTRANDVTEAVKEELKYYNTVEASSLEDLFMGPHSC